MNVEFDIRDFLDGRFKSTNWFETTKGMTMDSSLTVRTPLGANNDGSRHSILDEFKVPEGGIIVLANSRLVTSNRKGTEPCVIHIFNVYVKKPKTKPKNSATSHK